MTYRYYDETARPGVTYYYWLEEISWRYKATVYGPAIRKGTVSGGGTGGGTTAPLKVLAAFSTSTTGGLYRIRYETLAAAGLPARGVATDAVAVRVAGRTVPIYVNSEGPQLAAGDEILFYAPPSPKGLACQVTLDEPGATMGLRSAAPVHGPGKVYTARVGARQRVAFETDPAYVRYFLYGFEETPVWVVDITVPTNAALLYGYAYVMDTNGQSGVYLSLDPAYHTEKCLAVQDRAVIEVKQVVKP